ncbi:maestro heat-like repeat-containing protein family member 2A isoform X2 [Pteropus medius]|uniref:maestro heat-like repeat-containing protein family member 2A isoform X2 n=1 Tax=Pteropus vampyrus TaxID=132908 RepID=UPI00196A37CA|nr:maestro heat-like repeat-containing protein family member 2A isoform X2 [Pteropus giganteus]
MLSLLLPNDNLWEQVYDYIPLLLAEYQGSLEALFITQVLRHILEVSVTTSTLVPQMQLHTIFTELHVQVCTKAPARQQYSGQNLTEVVHCFIALDVDEQGGRPRGDADPDQGSGERRCFAGHRLNGAIAHSATRSFYQRYLEEKMVHKLTMVTVRIITSSVSGMTNWTYQHRRSC